ncbi:MAG: GDP-mannose 4,6-dehydratase [Candidatus Promineifilaceae bacterium]
MAKILVTGGAGFIGSNLSSRLLDEGHEVVIFDNFSRSGAVRNLQWLIDRPGSEKLRVVEADLLDFEALKKKAEGVQRVYHLAGQVAVTTSVADPRNDFLDNALGTFNALEAARLVGDDPIFLYASTNKVYGGMEDVVIVEKDNRYTYADFPRGIPETTNLDFHSPYGCSKGSGDQYTRDYYRIYGLRTVVLRQSCIYGYRQFGIEDQGWIAWFMIAVLKNKPITIYGDGKQVRDVLFIDDLLDAYAAAVDQIDTAAGQIYNVGGGPANTMAIWTEFGPMLEEMLGWPIQVQSAGWRPGDQKVYISNIDKIKRDLGWEPEVGVREGLQRLFDWMSQNQQLFDHL